MRDLSKVSFGATAAVTSCLALIIGLSQIGISSRGLVGALLVLGLADNIADSLGIHIYSESRTKEYSTFDTFTNYFTRFGITLVFIAFMLFLPASYAIAACVAAGLAVIAVLSYFIAKSRCCENPHKAVAEHVVIAALVLVVSLIVGASIKAWFPA